MKLAGGFMKDKLLKLIFLLSFVFAFVFGIDTNAYAEIYDGTENVENNAEENKEQNKEENAVAGSADEVEKSAEQSTSLEEVGENNSLQESQSEYIQSESIDNAHESSSESSDASRPTESESSNGVDESSDENKPAESIDNNIDAKQSFENVNSVDKKNKEKDESINGQLNGTEDKKDNSESLKKDENKKQESSEKVTQDYISSVLRAPKSETTERAIGKWVKDSKGSRYKYSDGSYAKNKWLDLEGHLFHVDKNGYMETGWERIDSKWYYFSSSGYMQRGLITVKGNKYLLADNGVMLTGWRDYENDRYFFVDSGEAYCSGWKQDGKIWRYLDKSGKVDKQFDSKLIIDVSEFQDPKNINYDELSKQITGVIIRAGGTYMLKKEYYLDDEFETHYKEFKRRNIPVGAYWFSCATNAKEGLNEAKYMYNNVLKGRKFELPIFWDTEDEVNQRPASRKNLTEAGKAFLGYLTDKNYKAGIYASASWLDSELDMDKLDEYDVWVAHYESNFPDYDGDYEIHQYTGSGRLKGYDGSIDISRISVKKDYPAEIKKAKLNGYNTNTNASTNSNGNIAFEWIYKNNNWYCRDAKNNLQRGWVTVAGYWYYLNNDYTLFRNGWLKWNNNWYYMYKGGSMASNEWVKRDGNWYYMYRGGSMASNEWVKWDGKWYYMYRGGSMASDGWLKWNGKWYYMYKGGSMASDEWVKWNGKWYYLTGSGAMLTNGYADGYYVNSRGEWV